MTLRAITGRAVRKTIVHREIVEDLKSNLFAIRFLVVPDQMSFMTEYERRRNEIEGISVHK